MPMDVVRISHLRQFANAVASALQGAVDRGIQRSEHVSDMLNAFGRSIDADKFFSEDTATVAAPTGVSFSTQEVATKHIAPPKRLQTSTVATPVTRPGFPALAAGASFTMSKVLASRFFVEIPWGGQTFSKRVNEQTPTNQVIEDKLSSVVASSFFASIPWRRTGGEDLSIAAESENTEKIKGLIERLGRSEPPAFMRLPQSLTTPTAVGFFTKIPWAGQRLRG